MKKLLVSLLLLTIPSLSPAAAAAAGLSAERKMPIFVLNADGNMRPFIDPSSKAPVEFALHSKGFFDRLTEIYNYYCDELRGSTLCLCWNLDDKAAMSVEAIANPVHLYNLFHAKPFERVPYTQPPDMIVAVKGVARDNHRVSIVHTKDKDRRVMGDLVLPDFWNNDTIVSAIIDRFNYFYGDAYQSSECFFCYDAYRYQERPLKMFLPKSGDNLALCALLAVYGIPNSIELVQKGERGGDSIHRVTVSFNGERSVVETNKSNFVPLIQKVISAIRPDKGYVITAIYKDHPSQKTTASRIFELMCSWGELPDELAVQECEKGVEYDLIYGEAATASLSPEEYAAVVASAEALRAVADGHGPLVEFSAAHEAALRADMEAMRRTCGFPDPDLTPYSIENLLLMRSSVPLTGPGIGYGSESRTRPQVRRRTAAEAAAAAVAAAEAVRAREAAPESGRKRGREEYHRGASGGSGAPA